MPQATIKVNGKEFELNGTVAEIKQKAVSLIRFQSAAAQNRFLKELVIDDNIKPQENKDK